MSGATALFGNVARSQNKNLIEFRAGKMSVSGAKVTPDKRKGMVYVYQSEDSLMHFCWKDRANGTVEDDLIIFPDDVEFKRVVQCTTGRVYILKFKSNERKFFYWLQEPSEDKDEENCRKINEVLNNPPAYPSQRSGGGTPDGDLQNLLSSMSQQQLMQLFGGVGQMGGLSNLIGTMNRPVRSANVTSASSTTTPSTNTTSTPTSTPVATSNPTLSTQKTPATPESSHLKPSTPQAPAVKRKFANLPDFTDTFTTKLIKCFLSKLQGNSNVDLASSFDTETVAHNLSSDEELLEDLKQFLPGGSAADVSEGTTQERLLKTVNSLQFKEALSMFSTALQSGSLGSVVSQFEMPEEAVKAANEGNMEEFVKALQAANIKDGKKDDKKESKKEKEGDSDKDEDMPVD